jgi:hypothetical protein
MVASRRPRERPPRCPFPRRPSSLYFHLPCHRAFTQGRARIYSTKDSDELSSNPEDFSYVVASYFLWRDST